MVLTTSIAKLFYTIDHWLTFLPDDCFRRFSRLRVDHLFDLGLDFRRDVRVPGTVALVQQAMSAH